MKKTKKIRNFWKVNEINEIINVFYEPQEKVWKC